MANMIYRQNIFVVVYFQNTLNPDWDDFLFKEADWNGNDKELNLKLEFAICLTDFIFWSLFRIEVFDDDRQKGPDGKDDLIGTAFYSLKQLEAEALLMSLLPLSDGRKKKPSGQLCVR